MECGSFYQHVETVCTPLKLRSSQAAQRALITLATAFWTALPLATFAEPTSDQASQPSAKSADQRATVVESLRYDASLSDVFFLDANTGWAVGDRGVIWHTRDGGTTWNQQSSGVSCSLKSVHFIDAQQGWSVGGEYQPYTGDAHGVVLHTSDSGRTWKRSPTPGLPILTRVKFLDANRGFLVGSTSATQPSGVLFTNDGGNTWKPLSTDRTGGWLAADFLDEEAGAVAGAGGRFATLARGQIVTSPLGVASLRSFRAMRLAAPTGGWLVGDGGRLLTTNDLGRSWQSPAGELPDFVADTFDFHSLATLGENVWIAGSPGTLVFHSSNAGKTWSTISTGHSTPLHALTFVDPDHGWAVGDLGAILVTIDGGKTWKVQRSSIRRAALLGLFASAGDVPLELLSAHGAAEGYVTAIDVIHSIAADESGIWSAREREAILLAGAASANTAWRFPIPPGDLAHSSADLLAHLNRASDGRAIEQIERHIVRSIRMWRPEIIITHRPNQHADNPQSAVAQALLMKSIQAAADPTRHAILAENVHLRPWQVKKVYGLLPSGEQGAEAVSSSQFSPWLGASLADYVAPARRLLQTDNNPTQPRYDLALLATTIQESNGSRGVFNGISISPGADSRRAMPDLPVDHLESLRKAADRKRHIQALLQRSEGNAAWVAQIDQTLESLNDDDGTELLHQLADGYRAAGRLDIAADTHYLLAKRYAQHALSARSLEWLIQFYSSSEIAHRLASRGSTNVRQAGLVVAPSNTEALDSTQGVRQAAATVPADSTPTVGLSRDDRLQRATQLAEYLRSSRPELYAEPRVRFAEVTALRQLGLANPAKRYFLTLRQRPETDAWRRCGETEMWLAQPADLPPAKALTTCRTTTEPPRLDGQLDEPLWESADRMRLHATDRAADEKAGAEIRFARNQEFLFVAARCPKVKGGDYNSNNRPRPRDADLSQNDRIMLRIDIDRDYATAFELTVNSRGLTHDACWDDAHWNPEWYVSAADNVESWTIEAAIPLKELTDSPPAARTVWAISACRTIPRVGYESWTGSADASSPDSFGLMIFE